MPLKIVNLDERLWYARFMFYGDSGVGKTYFVKSLPKPVLYVECDLGGADTLRGEPGIVVVEFEQFGTIAEVFTYLKQHIEEFKSVAIDGLSSIQGALIWETAQDPNRKNPQSDYVPTITGWGDVLGRMRRLVKVFHTLPLHIYYTALEELIPDPSVPPPPPDEKGRPSQPTAWKLYPKLQGAFQKTIGGDVSEIGRMYIQTYPGEVAKPSNYKLSFAGSSQFQSKVRNKEIGIEPKVYSNPKFEDLVPHLIRKEKE